MGNDAARVGVLPAQAWVVPGYGSLRRYLNGDPRSGVGGPRRLR